MIKMEIKLRPEIKVFFLCCKLLPFVWYYWIRDALMNLVPQRFIARKDITGQTVLITGAGSGIGRQLSIKFSQHSMRLVLMDVNKDSLFETEKLLDSSSTAYLHKCDVSKREMVYDVAKQIKDQVGKVDILVNNAGIVNGKSFLRLTDEQIVKTMEVNTMAHFWLLKAFLPDMIHSNQGHIVSIASQAGLTGLPSLTDYCASKFAAVGLMESLQLELERKELNGVKTTTVCPSLVSTGLFAGSGTVISAVLEPEQVAQRIMEGIFYNEGLVLIPDWTKLIYVFKWTMPTEVVRAFYKRVGLRDFMSSFIGRSEQGPNQSASPQVVINNGSGSTTNGKEPTP